MDFIDPTRIKVTYLHYATQRIHFYYTTLLDNEKTWCQLKKRCTAIYASNIPDQRKVLWQDMKQLQRNVQGPRFLMGDNNNVLLAQDRIGGKAINEAEYSDLTNMMEKTGLFENDSSGDYYIWTNKQANNTIYSGIDRITGNFQWHVLHINTILYILGQGVSDRALLCLQKPEARLIRRSHFKFQNIVTNVEGYQTAIANSWNHPCQGTTMNILWKKLHRLKPIIKKMSKHINTIHLQLAKSRTNLEEAQKEVILDRFSRLKIDKVKICTGNVLKLSNLEEHTLRQRSKLKWLQVGDGNNVYFHATLKTKQS